MQVTRHASMIRKMAAPTKPKYEKSAQYRIAETKEGWSLRTHVWTLASYYGTPFRARKATRQKHIIILSDDRSVFTFDHGQIKKMSIRPRSCTHTSLTFKGLKGSGGKEETRSGQPKSRDERIRWVILWWFVQGKGY